jgi:hypothetical protein
MAYVCRDLMKNTKNRQDSFFFQRKKPNRSHPEDEAEILTATLQRCIVAFKLQNYLL